LIAISVLGSLALCLLVAGCGGGDDDSAEAQPIDKATFAKRATSICKQASGRIAGGVSAEIKSKSTTAVDLVQKVLIPGLETELEELRALGVPTEGKQEVQAFFKASQNVIEKAKADPGTFATSVSPYEAAELAGRRLGVTTCPATAGTPS
jgi:hypothetical protein